MLNLRQVMFSWIRQKIHTININKLDFINIKNFLFRETIKKIKTQATGWEKYSPHFYLAKDLYPQYIKNSYVQ